jgi:hypothetical protein
VWLRCGAHPFGHRPASRLFLVDVPELAVMADHLLGRLLLLRARDELEAGARRLPREPRP